MSSPTAPHELSMHAFVHDFALQHRTRINRPFCWILGAGASVSSGIPMARERSLRFLRDLHREPPGMTLSFEQWVESGGAGIDGLDLKNPERHYPEICERRFRDCRDAGYAFLEEEMRDKIPSYGYAVLASLLAETHHRVVITTNFDNLVADALAMHTATFPRVIGLTRLTEYVEPGMGRPLIAKIHGDLGFRMQNESAEIARLDERWEAVLKKILQRFTPIVIGYGGNDHTLMTMLKKLPADTLDMIYWCEMEGATLSPEVNDFLALRKSARLVRHPGFDLLMIQLEEHLRAERVLPLPDLLQSLTKRQKERLQHFRAQRAQLAERRPKTSSPAFQPDAKTSNANPLAFHRAAANVPGATGEKKMWWQWQREIEAINDPAQKEAHYTTAIRAVPHSALLLGNYANFLRLERRDLGQAEALYKRAIEAAPRHANNLGNYASFLRVERRDLDQADVFYKRAVEADPTHANNLGSYASFLCEERRDLDQADVFYKRAIEADPTHAINLGNYTQLLLSLGRRQEGWSLLKRCEAQMQPGEKGLAAELCFYRLAHAPEQWPAHLRKLRKLLEAGARSRGWRLESNTERARLDGHPHVPLLEALAAVITKDAPLNTLDAFPEWVEAGKPEPSA